MPLVFKPGTSYGNYLLGEEILIQKIPVKSAAAHFLGGLRITESKGSILNMFLLDATTNRACDVLNMLIEKYNDDAIREKNRSAVNTASFGIFSEMIQGSPLACASNSANGVPSLKEGKTNTSKPLKILYTSKDGP